MGILLTVMEITVVILGLGFISIRWVYNSIFQKGVKATKWVAETEAYLSVSGYTKKQIEHAEAEARAFLEEQKAKKNKA